MYPIAQIRQQFLGLTQNDAQGQPPIFFDGPGGSQLPKSVVATLANYLYCFNSNMGGTAHAGIVTTKVNDKARAAAAIWLNASPKNIIFGLNSTSLMFNIARAVARTWQAGDNIVLSSIEHFSHVSSWQEAAIDCGVEVRFIPLNHDASTLDLTTLNTLIDNKTRLVAVSLASNVLGTKTDIATIATIAKSVGAILSYDAVHAIVHEPVDVVALGCDLLFASAYKIGGAHLGICYMADSLIGIRPYKVTPATNIPPNAWEQGTQSFEAQASLVALMHYWANLATINLATMDKGDTANNDDWSHDLLALLDKPLPARQSLIESHRLVGEYETMLAERFLSFAKQRDYLVLYGNHHANNRTPTFAFNVQKNGKLINPSAISDYFGTKNIALPSGNFYALKVAEALDLVETNFLRVGFLHYSTASEIDELFKLLDEFVANYK